MSRSWERKVRKNMSNINKQRKKHGEGNIVLGSQQTDKFYGRNFIMPAFLLLFIMMYLVLVSGAGALVTDTIFWLTIASYIGLAALFFFRRPYLLIGKDYVQTRRMTGDKQLKSSSITGIEFQKTAIIIQQEKGTNWVFSKVLNRYSLEPMKEKLTLFAKNNNIEIKET